MEIKNKGASDMKGLNLLILVFFIFTSCNSHKNQGFSLIKMNDNDTYDEYLEIVKNEYRNNKTPVIYYHASWCGPCEKFNETIETDFAAKEKLKDFTIIQLDISQLSNCKFDTIRIGDILACMDKKRSNHIPMFCKVDIMGNPVNWITGASWIIQNPQRIEYFIKLIQMENVKSYIAPVNK